MTPDSQEGNPATPTVVSPMGELVPRRHTIRMPPSTGPSSSESASPDWQQVQTLRVADVVMTILKARKAMPSATAATVSRTRHGSGYRVLVRLMEGCPSADAANPEDDLDCTMEGTAAVFVARELGQDLADTFGDKDVFILQ
jgi:hypothetical protein